MHAYLSLLTALAGLLLYLLPTGGKLQEVGRILLFCGTLATLFAVGGRTIHLPLG